MSLLREEVESAGISNTVNSIGGLIDWLQYSIDTEGIVTLQENE